MASILLSGSDSITIRVEEAERSVWLATRNPIVFLSDPFDDSDPPFDLANYQFIELAPEDGEDERSVEQAISRNQQIFLRGSAEAERMFAKSLINAPVGDVISNIRP